jgi:putative lipoic acid-binding regulatory protein
MILDGKKPEINYPTKWDYKIIGSSVDEMLKAVEETIVGLDYQVTPSKISKNEKYFSLNVTVLVPSEILRDLIFQKLSSHPHIKFVI